MSYIAGEVDEEVAEVSPGRLQDMLADSVLVIFNGDFGENHEATSEDYLSLCDNEGIYVQTLNPAGLTEVNSAMDNERCSVLVLKFASSKNLRLKITIQKRGGPILLLNFEYSGFPRPMNEIFLSRPLLQVL